MKVPSSRFDALGTIDDFVSVGVLATELSGLHRFLSVTKAGDSAIVVTKGNDTCHVILRGGKSGPNFQPEAVAEVRGVMEKLGFLCLGTDCLDAWFWYQS